MWQCRGNIITLAQVLFVDDDSSLLSFVCACGGAMRTSLPWHRSFLSMTTVLCRALWCLCVCVRVAVTRANIITLAQARFVDDDSSSQSFVVCVRVAVTCEHHEGV